MCSLRLCCEKKYIYVYIFNDILHFFITWWWGVPIASIMLLATMKIILILSLMFVWSYDAATSLSESNDINERPIIGILTQEQAFDFKNKYANENFTSYIAASYVKGVEASGARVVPILIGKTRDYYKDILSKINGVLFPGGATYFNQSNGYADAGQHIYEIAKDINDAGDYFPIFGTCLGFELLVILASGRGEPENRITCRAFGNFPISFTKDFRSSKMFSHIEDKLVDALENEDITINVHQFCIVDENLRKHNLTMDWRVTSYSDDEEGVKYISSIEHTRYPFYGVQFHPEKTAFEWKKSKNYAHTPNAIKANRYFMDFFVEECKKSSHKFADEKDENKYLIYNYKPYFTGAHGSSYSQCYFFEPREISL